MRPIQFAYFLAVIFGLGDAAYLPARQAPSCTPSTIWQYTWTYLTVTQTVTDIPATVTILQQDPNAVASSLASIDTIQVSQQDVEGPISGHRATTNTVFTHSVEVSGYEATELPHTGSSVFYMSKGSSHTDWSYTPSASIVAQVTTVTVLPVGRLTSARQDAVNTSSTSAHSAFTRPSGGWNGTLSGSSVGGTATGRIASTVSGTAFSYGPAPTSTVDPAGTAPTLTHYTSTVTQTATVYATSSSTSSIAYIPYLPYGYGPISPDWASAATSSPVGHDLEKRQTCVWVVATIGGQDVGWCNNWAGGSTLTYTSWETTTTPGIPVSNPSSASATSTESSLTIQTSTDLSPTATASPAPDGCGEVGPFQIGFDDLPIYYPENNDTADFPPIFNPYDHFFWGDGWAYVPPPNEPFPPQSGDRLAQFVPSLNNTVIGSPSAGSIPPSSFGAGPRNYDNTYWFTAKSAYVGCDNGARNASQVCDFVATAYQWDNQTQSELVVATQHFRIPPCAGFQNCQLTKITFNYLFYKMSTLSFYANVQGNVSQFWLDSLDLNWYNNTCEAGLARIQSRKMRNV